MLFNSYIFVLLFLPLTLIGYFFLNRFHLKKPAMFFLFGMSLWFYGYFYPGYLIILLSGIFINYLFYKLMDKTEKHLKRKALMITAVSINIALLFYFKYFDFFISNMNSIFKSNLPLQNILLPLGISFFTFQQISFIVDAYKKETPKYSFIDYACFVAFFPQLIAGPIVMHKKLIPQFADNSKKTFQWENMSRGIYMFVLGLSKKVLLADTLGKAVNWGFASIDYLNSTDVIIIMLSYTLQIYFDFSGYCDMAIGIARMFNIELPLNFNSPYKAKNIAEFWDRWHMTLTQFLTNYIYIPLGGNRKGTLRTYINVFIVFLISGFWHGANWTFVLWGICHGVLMIFTKALKKYLDKIPAFINWICTFLFINVTWLLFRADSLIDFTKILKIGFGCQFERMNQHLASSVHSIETPFVYKLFSAVFHLPPENTAIEWVILLVLAIGMIILAQKKNSYERMMQFKPTLPKLMTTCILFVWCVISFAGVSTFLYFNF